jgi:sterol desaturase/sphingolipid hydroxylase (fatty acid hydroxylase superfamily)
MNWIRLDSSAYWITFVAAFLAVALWESAHPLSPLAFAAGRRWRNHAVLYATTLVFSGVILRASPVFVAIAVASSRYGLLNRAAIPYWIRFAITFVALDLFHYASHRLFHAVHPMWQIHRVHHSDRDFDVSTGARFHPLEVIITQVLYLGTVALLAPPPAAVLAYGLLVVIENFFVHANKSLPLSVERVLRWVAITPDLHRIHHSEEPADYDLNFGEVFPWWDRLFGTYAGASARSPGNVVTGLKELSGVDTLPVLYMLTAPFRRLP